MCDRIIITIWTTVYRMRYEYPWNSEDHAQDDRFDAGAHGVPRSRQNARLEVSSLTGEPVVGTSRSTLVHVKHDGFTVLPHESGLRDFNSALDDVHSSVTQQIRGFGVNEWDTGSVREVEYMWWLQSPYVDWNRCWIVLFKRIPVDLFGIVWHIVGQ